MSTLFSLPNMSGSEEYSSSTIGQGLAEGGKAIASEAIAGRLITNKGVRSTHLTGCHEGIQKSMSTS